MEILKRKKKRKIHTFIHLLHFLINGKYLLHFSRLLLFTLLSSQKELFAVHIKLKSLNLFFKPFLLYLLPYYN